MKRAVVAAVVLSLAAGVSAQERQHRGSQQPPAGVMPPPAAPFAAKPDTYAPRFDSQLRVHPGAVLGVPFYENPATAVPPTPAAPAPEQKVTPPAAEPPKADELPPELPKMAALHGPDLFYVIPGCYAGNRPPNPERLPKGCDLAKLRTTPIR